MEPESQTDREAGREMCEEEDRAHSDLSEPPASTFSS
jgi:hypothetical protein